MQYFTHLISFYNKAKKMLLFRLVQWNRVEQQRGNICRQKVYLQATRAAFHLKRTTKNEKSTDKTVSVLYQL